jgi:hypothetical protein
MRRCLLAICIGALAAGAARAQSASPDEQARDRHLAGILQETLKHPRQTGRESLAWVLEREAVLRLLSILSGTPPSADKASGWLVPSRTRYSASWLLEQLDEDGDGAVSADEWRGRSEWFAKLDRDRDGYITAKDLNWLPDSPLAKASTNAKMLFRQLDADGDGQVSSTEWQEYMQKLAQGRAYLTQDDLLPLFASGAGGKGKAGKRKGQGGINLVLLKAFFEGDVASVFEGPRPGTRAPDFTLPTVDGKSKLTLSKSFGRKPVVLVFGSFT